MAALQHDPLIQPASQQVPFEEVVKQFQKRRCTGCDGITEAYATKHTFFDKPVCHKCARSADLSTITTSAAKAEYRLNDADLATLRCKKKANPRYRGAAPMRLYLRRDLKKKADEKYVAKNSSLQEAQQKAAASKRKRDEK